MVRDTEGGLLMDECEVPVSNQRAVGVLPNSTPGSDSYRESLLRHRPFRQKPEQKSAEL